MIDNCQDSQALQNEQQPFSAAVFMAGLLRQMRASQQEHGRLQLYPVLWESSRVGRWVLTDDVAHGAGLPGNTWLHSPAYARLVASGQPLIRRRRELSRDDVRVAKERRTTMGIDYVIRIRRWPCIWSTISIRLVRDVNGCNWMFLLADAPAVLPWLEEERGGMSNEEQEVIAS